MALLFEDFADDRSAEYLGFLFKQQWDKVDQTHDFLVMGSMPMLAALHGDHLDAGHSNIAYSIEVIDGNPTITEHKQEKSYKRSLRDYIPILVDNTLYGVGVGWTSRKICYYCGEKTKKICSKCGVARFCDRDHLRAAWKKHKHECRVFTEIRNQHK